MFTEIAPPQDRLDRISPNLRYFMQKYLDASDKSTFMKPETCFDLAYPKNERSLLGGYTSGREVLKLPAARTMLQALLPSVEQLQARLDWVIEKAIEADDLGRVESAVMSLAKLGGHLKEINQNNVVIINQSEKDAIKELAREAIEALPNSSQSE